MNETYTNPPDNAGDSWANEKLPMRVRRELLDREIRQLSDRTARAQAEDGESPSAQRPASSERLGG